MAEKVTGMDVLFINGPLDDEKHYVTFKQMNKVLYIYVTIDGVRSKHMYLFKKLEDVSSSDTPYYLHAGEVNE